MKTEELMLILNSFIYSNGFSSDNDIFGMNLYNIVTTRNFDKPDNMIASKEEWNALLNTVKQNKEYCSNIVLNNVEETKDAEKNVCFSNNNTGETYIVYKGTDSLEWHDNALGGSLVVAETPQQLNALAYANKMSKQYGSLIVSGHSKGGNKAQFVALLSDQVSKAYSFDGQGMGVGFLIKYKDLIASRKNKTTSISNRSNFVNPPFRNIAGINIFTDNKGSLNEWLFAKDFSSLARQHSPFTMFSMKDDILKMMSTNDILQNTTSVFIGNMIDYIGKNMSEEDFEIFSNYIMHLLENGSCNEGFNAGDIPSDFWGRLVLQIIAFGRECDIEIADIFSMLSMLSTFIPELSIKNLKLNPTLMGEYGLLFSIIGGSISKKRTVDIMNNFNQKYSAVIQKEQLVRDFSMEAQQAMYECLNMGVDKEMASVQAIPYWPQVADTLSRTGFEEVQGIITSFFVELIDQEEMTKTRYEQIIELVYQEDRELSLRLEKKVDIFRDYRQDIRNRMID